MSLPPLSPAIAGTVGSVAPTGVPAKLGPGADFIEAIATIAVTNADPTGELSLELEAPAEHWASFRTPTAIDEAISGDAPELVAVDPFSVWVRIGADPHDDDSYGGSFDFTLRLAVCLSAAVDQLRLSARAAPGTEIAASVAGLGGGRLADGEAVLRRER